MGGVEGPAWNLSEIYAGFESPAFCADFEGVLRDLDSLEAQATSLVEIQDNAENLSKEQLLRKVPLLQDLARELEAVELTLGELRAYAHAQCLLDARNPEAMAWLERLDRTSAVARGLEAAFESVLASGPTDLVEGFLDSPGTRAWREQVERWRRGKPAGLSLSEANLVGSLEAYGPRAFSALWQTIAGGLEIEVLDPEGRQTRYRAAEIRSLLEDPDPRVRQAAHVAHRRAWRPHLSSCAAALNGLAGWRLEVDRLGSPSEPCDVLEASLRRARIGRDSLEALLAAVRARQADLRRFPILKARAAGLEAPTPWDRHAPSPFGPASCLEYPEAIAAIEASLEAFSPPMGAFVRRAREVGWIEGRRLAGKQDVAFAAFFPRSREPRVFMTYTGTPASVATLAHELGHGYHFTLLAGLPRCQRALPLTLAETASILAQSVVTQALGREAAPRAPGLAYLWERARMVETFLMLDRLHFEFETAVYRERKAGVLPVETLDELWCSAWAEVYGEGAPCPDSSGWARTFFFFLPDHRFYSYPYTFGYLLAQVLMARRDEDPRAFPGTYEAFLRDSGRLEVEDLTRKHLGLDLGDPQFWSAALLRVLELANALEAELQNRPV